jgi:hypothetical protein
VSDESSVAQRPRIRPDLALRPGTADARNLLIVWYLRKSVYGLVALGIIGGAITRTNLDVDWTSGDAVMSRLWSPLAPLVIGLVLRLAANFAALLLALPLARAYEVGLSPRTNFGSGFGHMLDRLNLARAYRALRWTHHVRQLALTRLGEKGRKVARLDPIMDVTNITLWVVAVVALIATGAGTT